MVSLLRNLQADSSTVLTVSIPESPLTEAAPSALRTGISFVESLRAALRWAASAAGLSLLDQAVVSGANFATTILLGRLAWQAELGTYWLGMSLVLLLLAAQNALISSPFTLYSQRSPRRTAGELAGVATLHVGALALLVGVSFCLLAALGESISLSAEMIRLFVALAIVSPLVMLRELARRVSLAKLDLKSVLLIDASAAAVQLFALGWLGYRGTLAALPALGICGAVGGAVGIVWLFAQRRALRLRPALALEEIPRYWSLGKWELIDQVTVTANVYLVYWLLAAWGGAGATGLYSACMTLVSLANPFVFGMTNILAPRLAGAQDSAGQCGVRRLVWTSTLLLAGIVGAYTLLLIFGGEQLVALCYGRQFAGQQATIATCAIAAWFTVLGTSAAHGLWARERTDINFIATLAGFGLTLLVAVPLFPHWGVLAATTGLILGNASATLIRLIAFIARDPAAAPLQAA